MKRIHVSVGVNNLKESINFYSIIFAAEPSVIKDDYAKWMLDDPRLNFSISSRLNNQGLDHLGIQVENNEELEEIGARFDEAKINTAHQQDTTCCYARSDKIWATDPSGIARESFVTHGESAEYGASDEKGDTVCCTPTQESSAQTTASCC